MRYLALDLGTKRIGVAVCDELEFGCYPRTTLNRGRSRADDLAVILKLVQQEQAEGIVIGLPLTEQGEGGPWTDHVRSFAAALADVCPLPVHLQNEYLSSAIADETLREQGVSFRRRERVIDQMAAVEILESFLRTRKERT